MPIELDEGSKQLIKDLEELLEEAKAGEFGDFTNEKYPAPKLALANKLGNMKVKVMEGEYD